ncbi:MAG TPA: SdpI family protein [Spirochaetia bacterium]|nr:SdpI family protein [Spirochaetia bacterium]
MRNSREGFLLVFLTSMSVFLAVVLYGAMPSRMVTHWGIDGLPNGWMDKFWGLAIYPLINLFLLLVYYGVPVLEPKKKNLAAFRKDYDRLMMWIFGVLNYIFILSFVYNLGVVFDMGRMVIPALGLLYVAIGMILPRSKQNFMVGIRTPWSLASEKVWQKTHFFGGRLFVFAGLVTIGSVFLPSRWGFFILIGSILLVTLLTVVYSWKVYRRETK